MKFRFDDASSIKASIEGITSIVEEGIFEINKQGLYLKAIDPSLISMVLFSMPRECFSDFNIPEERKIGLNIIQLSEVLGRGNKDEKVEFEINNAQLTIRFLKEKKKRTFQIPILDIEEGVQKEPLIEYKSFVKINATGFKEILKDVKLISSHVKFSITPASFLAEVAGERGSMRAEFGKESKEILELKSEDNAVSTYPLQYLEDITKASPGSEPLCIFIKTDKPLKLEYKIGGAEVRYYLAPRTESG